MKIVYACLLAIAAFSCTKIISPKLDSDAGQLDIEANITDQYTPQQIFLRANTPFSASNQYPAVTNATVTITDDAGSNYTFTATQPGTYTGPAFSGIAGRTYRLQVQVDTHQYTATSTMPSLVRLDSLTARNRPLNRPQSGRDQKVISVYYHDPSGTPNQYRFIEWVNGAQVNSVFTYDDQLTDGRYVTLDLLEQDIDIYAGDTVRVEMQCIDKPIYTYWFALVSQQANNFNGAVAPANPPTNIGPQTLGYFSAHTTQTMTLIVK